MMRLVSFSAETPAAALAQIQKQLGPDAVVLAVRPLSTAGLGRFWPKQRRVEVLAGVAEEQGSGKHPQESAHPEQGRGGVQNSDGAFPLRAENLTSAPPLYDDTGRPHVFIGPPGVGKTTLLCKWLVTAVLGEGRAVRLFRLDGTNANTAELLTVYGEMFGLAVERTWQTPHDRGLRIADCAMESHEFESAAEPRLLLIDLPGVEMGDVQALSAAREQLATLPRPRLHLVLNAAYDSSTLLAQFRAFAPFQPEDLSFTHLDEDQRREKMLALATGTNCPVRFLSGGQKIPGQFVAVPGS